jgi:hypothetical protein
LPMRLPFIMAVADHRHAVTPRAAHALRPAMLVHQRETLRLVEQPRERLIRSDTAMMTQAPQASRMTSSAHQIRAFRPSLPPPGLPPRNPTRAASFSEIVVARIPPWLVIAHPDVCAAQQVSDGGAHFEPYQDS